MLFNHSSNRAVRDRICLPRRIWPGSGVHILWMEVDLYCEPRFWSRHGMPWSIFQSTSIWFRSPYLDADSGSVLCPIYTTHIKI